MENNKTQQVTLKESWGNIWYVFFRDLKRLVRNPIATMVLLFVLVFPSLYAWVGVHANWDPYAKTSGLKIAIVNEDKPADTGIAGTIDLGTMLVDALKEQPLLGWDFTNKDDAMQKLDKGEVYAAIVIPEDFSAGFAKLFNDSQNRTFVSFDYYINERENGAAVKIFDIASSTIEDQINQRFIETVSNVLAEKAHDVTGNVSEHASSAASTISGKVEYAAESIHRLNDLLESGKATTEQAKNTLSSANKLIADVKHETNNVLDSVDRTKQKCQSLRDRVHQSIEDLERLGLDLKVVKEVLTNLEKSIDENLNGLDKISELMHKVDSTCNQLSTLTGQINNLIDTTDNLSGGLKQNVQGVYERVHKLSKIIDDDIAGAPIVLRAILEANSQNLGKFLSMPVDLDKHVINEVKLYGYGAAPFFMNLTLWIAGLVLIALFRTEVDPPPRKKFNTHQAYISRGLLFALVAVLQGLVCAVGELIIGIQPDSVLLFIVTSMFASFTYTSIIYMLSACFKHVGKAIAVVLIIMQIPGSSGMFPVAMMPAAYQAINPLLPFTYGIDGLREAIVNPNYAAWLWDMCALAIFVILSFIIGIYARRGLVNINQLFDKKLAKSGVMECDAKDHLGTTKSSVDEVIELLSNTDYEDGIKDNLLEMKQKYKNKKKVAMLILWIVPALLLVIASVVFHFVAVDINTKILILMLWLVVAIGCCSYVIVLAFKYARLKKQLKAPILKEAEIQEDHKSAYSSDTFVVQETIF